MEYVSFARFRTSFEKLKSQNPKISKMESLGMALNLPGQNLTRIEVEGNFLKCYRENELLQVRSLENVTSLDYSRNQLTSLPGSKRFSSTRKEK